MPAVRTSQRIRSSPFSSTRNCITPLSSEHGVAYRHVVDQVVIVNRDGVLLLPACAAHRDFQNVANRERDRAADRPVRIAGPCVSRRSATLRSARCASARTRGDDLAHPIVFRVAHVESEDVGARPRSSPG